LCGLPIHTTVTAIKYRKQIRPAPNKQHGQ
jgi:hypothetical protein